MKTERTSFFVLEVEPSPEREREASASLSTLLLLTLDEDEERFHHLFASALVRFLRHGQNGEGTAEKI